MREFGESASEKKPSGCLRYFLYTGCATFTLMVAGIIILPSLILVSLFGDTDPDPGWERKLLPEEIHISKILLSQHHRGGFLEGCVFVAYALAPDTIGTIENQGGSFFRQLGQPPRMERNFYGPWKPTPVPEKPYLFASGAMDGCNNDSTVRQTFGRTEFLTEEGNFYAITENREGIIIVLPKRRLVIHGYFG